MSCCSPARASCWRCGRRGGMPGHGSCCWPRCSCSIPTLLYYGGGWLQYGYRYFLDSIPFVWALVALGIVHRGETPWWGWTLILWGVLIGLGGVYWAYHL